MDINPDHFSVSSSMKREYRFLPNSAVMAVVGVGLTMIPLTLWLESSTRLRLAFNCRVGYAKRLVGRQDSQTVVFGKKING